MRASRPARPTKKPNAAQAASTATRPGRRELPVEQNPGQSPQQADFLTRQRLREAPHYPRRSGVIGRPAREVVREKIVDMVVAHGLTPVEFWAERVAQILLGAHQQSFHRFDRRIENLGGLRIA